MRYYTNCQVSPSINPDTYYQRTAFKHAPPGYLFHDSDGLDIEALRPALRKLRYLHNDPVAILAYRRDLKTIAVSFSNTGIPHPTAKLINYYGYSEANMLRAYNRMAYVLPDIRDDAQTFTAIDLKETYDDCTRLEKMCGVCPCAIAGDECVSINIRPKLPSAGFDPQPEVIESKIFRLKRWRELDNFVFVTPAATTKWDFEKSLRDWDQHDFDLVPTRKQYLSERSGARHRTVKHRTTECAKCAFSEGANSDCGWIRYCSTGAVSESEAWTFIENEYTKSGFNKGVTGFSHAERNYLMSRGGDEVRGYHSNYFSRKRNLRLCGFIYRRWYGSWVYKVTTARGDITRETLYTNYADLCKAIPELPAVVPTVTIERKLEIAAEILGRKAWLDTRIPFHGSAGSHHITVGSNHVNLAGSTTRRYRGNLTLYNNSPVKDYVAATATRFIDVKALLPVVY